MCHRDDVQSSNTISKHQSVHSSCSLRSLHGPLFRTPRDQLEDLSRLDQSLFFSFARTKSSHFTASKDLFSSSVDVLRWQFEVFDSSSQLTNSSSFNFEIHSPSTNSSCSIQTSNGRTSTSFSVSSPDWFDQDEIKGYSLYNRFTDSFGSSRHMLIALSLDPSNFDV